MSGDKAKIEQRQLSLRRVSQDQVLELLAAADIHERETPKPGQQGRIPDRPEFQTHLRHHDLQPTGTLLLPKAAANDNRRDNDKHDGQNNNSNQGFPFVLVTFRRRD